MSKIEVNTVDVQCGSSLTLGSSGKIIFKYYNGSAFVSVFEVSTTGATATIPSTVTIEGESDPNAIPFAIALGG